MQVNPINNCQSFQARIKINKADAAKILLGGAALATTGFYSAQSGFQRDLVGSSIINGEVDLGSANDIQSVKEYVKGGIDRLNAHNNYLNEHGGRPSELDGIDRLVGSIGLSSSASGAYISKVGASALYTGEIDDKSVEEKKLPS
jgi:hypothetical protein